MTREDQWQPIETAPKDGTVILVCGGGKSSDLSDETTLDFPMIVEWQEDYEWIARHTCYYGIYAVNPTHWMPLPEAPKLNKGE